MTGSVPCSLSALDDHVISFPGSCLMQAVADPGMLGQGGGGLAGGDGVGHGSDQTQVGPLRVAGDSAGVPHTGCWDR